MVSNSVRFAVSEAGCDTEMETCLVSQVLRIAGKDAKIVLSVSYSMCVCVHVACASVYSYSERVVTLSIDIPPCAWRKQRSNIISG